MRISQSNHIYLFRTATVKDRDMSELEGNRSNVYKSVKPIDEFLKAIEPLSIENIIND